MRLMNRFIGQWSGLLIIVVYARVHIPNANTCFLIMGAAVRFITSADY